MTDIDRIIADIRAAGAGRTRYEGQTPRRDEALVAEIDRLRAAAPAPPIDFHAIPPELREPFWAIRGALFETGLLTGDEADVWAWRIVHQIPGRS